MPKKNTRNTRGRIIAAAWKLFYDQGYEETTVEDIVYESQTSKGSFYHYFKGKDELMGTLANVFDEKYEALMQTMDPRLDVSSLGEVIRILAVRYICAAAVALFVWFALPAPLVMRQSLTAAVFAATPSAALIYSNRLGIRTEIAGALSPISTVLMIPMMSAVMTLTV